MILQIPYDNYITKCAKLILFPFVKKRESSQCCSQLACYCSTVLLHLVDFLLGFGSLVCKNVQEKRRERERKIGGQKDMSERRIATDLYYYYGEIDCKNKSMLKLHVSYIKEQSKNMHSKIAVYSLFFNLDNLNLNLIGPKSNLRKLDILWL